MDNETLMGPEPHYTLGLRKVEIDAVLDACDLVGRVLQAAPGDNARGAARLLAEASREEHREAPLTRSILVQVARALQRRALQ